jgi:hypothetical protein
MSDQGTTAQAKEKVHEVAGQAQEKAQEVAGQARGQLRTQVDQRSTQAGEKVQGHASDLRSVGEQLRLQGKDQPAKLADQAAERLDRAGGWLKDSDGDRILHDVEDFARSKPMAVIAGGLLLGFAASRVLKASSTDRYETRGLAYGGRTLPLRAGEQRFYREPHMATPSMPAPPADPHVPPVPPGPVTGGGVA